MPNSWNRREVLTTGALAGAAALTRPLARAASPAGNLRLEGRMTPYPATWYRPYLSRPVSSATAPAWIQIDLGSAVPLQGVRLYPNFEYEPKSYGFPARFKVEGSSSEAFDKPVVLLEAVSEADPGDCIAYAEFSAATNPVRFVRLTALELRPLKPADRNSPPQYGLSFAKVELLSNGRDVAVGRPVTADRETGNPADLAQLTRKPRPQGEGILTDNPGNVSDPSNWKQVPYKAEAPRTGVSLGAGVFYDAMQNNIEYLLTSFSVDEMLRPFRERAGKPVPAGLRPPIPFWDTDLPGSSAGRFLMGAGNTLRWQEHPELRRRLNAIVDGIAECRQPNGYIMAYPEDTILHSERAGYTRAWVTHGLLEAGYAGHPKAFDLLRGYYDWFDNCPYLPKLLRGTAQGVQGMVANTRVYFVNGKPADIQVIQRYYQENFWLEGLARHDEAMVWQYPYDRPHNYLLTDIEAYLDLYRATGEARYLNAVMGAWQLYHDKWEHTGGSIAITEFGQFPPKSYRLNAQIEFCETGELCGSSFWTFLNQRLHQLDPDQEKYVTEIEKSIYNIGIANQFDGKGLYYHARLVGTKGDRQVSYCTNSCCEGQGTRLLGSIPEHLYTVVAGGHDPGVYIDLFAPSTVRWSQKSEAADARGDLHMEMKTSFPYNGKVELVLTTDAPRRSVLRVRTPSWAMAEMLVLVNGRRHATGKPGSYVVLDRTWKSGDTVSFTLPVDFRVTRYTGTDQIEGKQRYALEYGPILLAVAGSDDAELQVPGNPETHFARLLKADATRPLHFAVDGNAGHTYAPYYEIKTGAFTCFPAITTT